MISFHPNVPLLDLFPRPAQLGILSDHCVYRREDHEHPAHREERKEQHDEAVLNDDKRPENNTPNRQNRY